MTADIESAIASSSTCLSILERDPAVWAAPDGAALPFGELSSRVQKSKLWLFRVGLLLILAALLEISSALMVHIAASVRPDLIVESAVKAHSEATKLGQRRDRQGHERSEPDRQRNSYPPSAETATRDYWM